MVRRSLIADYSRTRVPADKTVSGLRVALIQISTGITLPAFLTGSEIGHGLGLARATLAFLIGGLLLAIIGGLTGAVGARTRVSTPMLIRTCFGSAGSNIVNAVMATSLFGWFGINVFLFGEAVQRTVLELGWVDPGHRTYMLVGSFLMVTTTIFGFKALDKLALLATPLLVTFLVVVVASALTDVTLPTLAQRPQGELTLGLGISAVVGSFLVGATMMPDFCRYTHNAGHALGASFLSFAVGFPAVLLASAIPTLATGETDLLNIVLALKIGLAATLFLIFATWTTNTTNLYSNSLVLVTIFNGPAKWKLVLGAGSLGTLLALLGIMNHFLPFLLLLGYALPPVGGILAADFFLVNRQAYEPDYPGRQIRFSLPALAAWISGSLVGYLTTNQSLTLTGIPACDSILTALAIYLILVKIVPRT